MKSILTSALLLTVLLLSSCKKETMPFKESENPDQNHKSVMMLSDDINNYTLSDIQAYTPETQQLVFAVLTAENKARLVKERIDFAIAQESDQSVIDHLNGLKQLVSAGLYAADRDPGIIEPVMTYIESIVTAVGYDKLKSIVTTWGGSGTVDHTPSGMVGYAQDCKCSSGDDWCSGIGKCANPDCNKASWGCGTLFWAKCDGICTLGIPNAINADWHQHGQFMYQKW